MFQFFFVYFKYIFFYLNTFIYLYAEIYYFIGFENKSDNYMISFVLYPPLPSSFTSHSCYFSCYMKNNEIMSKKNNQQFTNYQTKRITEKECSSNTPSG